MTRCGCDVTAWEWFEHRYKPIGADVRYYLRVVFNMRVLIYCKDVTCLIAFAVITKSVASLTCALLGIQPGSEAVFETGIQHVQATQYRCCCSTDPGGAAVVRKCNQQVDGSFQMDLEP
jgi:hypothetical protein